MSEYLVSPLPTTSTPSHPVAMSLPPRSDWVLLSKEQERIMDEEEAKAKAALISDEGEWDCHDALEAAQEDPSLNEWPDWEPKTHSIV